MLKQEFLRLAHQYPVAPAIKFTGAQESALSSDATLLFILRGDAFQLEQFIGQAHEHGKKVIVHVDLIEGIGKDRAGMQYLVQIGVDGIITSRSQLIASGRAEGLITIQRLLLTDEDVLDASIRAITHAKPDVIEILPGIIFPSVAGLLRKSITIPLITGGFIRTAKDVFRMQSAGALFCSSSTEALWNRNNLEPEMDKRFQN